VAAGAWTGAGRCPAARATSVGGAGLWRGAGRLAGGVVDWLCCLPPLLQPQMGATAATASTGAVRKWLTLEIGP